MNFYPPVPVPAESPTIARFITGEAGEAQRGTLLAPVCVDGSVAAGGTIWGAWRNWQTLLRGRRAAPEVWFMPRREGSSPSAPNLLPSSGDNGRSPETTRCARQLAGRWDQIAGIVEPLLVRPDSAEISIAINRPVTIQTPAANNL